MTYEALQSVTEGDTAAYEKMYTEYFKKFFNYGRKFTESITTIEDSIQEVFFSIWNNRAALPTIAALNAYLFSAFRHILLRKLKQESKTLLTEAYDEEPDFSIEQKIIATEEKEALTEKMQDAINALTPRQREAIFLRFYENLSYDEIAQVMNITVKATYKVMARGLEDLREKLNVSLAVLLPLLPFLLSFTKK